MAVTEDLLVRLQVDASGVLKGAKLVGKAFEGVGDEAQDSEKKVSKFEKGLEKAELSIIAVNQALQLMSAAFSQVGRVVGTFTNGFADFESALIGVQKTTNISGENLQQFGRDMQDLSEQIPVAANELLNIAQNAGQLGVAQRDIADFTETVAKIGFATDLSSEQAAQAFARILTVTGEGTANIDRFASVIVALGNNFAATESEITRVATEMANATAQFNLGSTNVLGLSTALKAMGQQAQLAGSVVGKSLRTINQIITEGSGPVFNQLAELTGMTGEQLQKTFKDDATAVFEAFIGGLNRIQESNGNVSQALETFGLKGDEVNKVLPSLAANADVLTSALKLARGEADLTAEELERIGALNVEAGNAFESLRAQITVAENSISNLVASLGEALAPAIRVILELFIDFVQFTKDIADGLVNMGLPGTIIAVTGLSTAIAAMVTVAIIPAVIALKSMAAAVGLTVAGIKAFAVAGAVVAAKVIAITAAVAALVAGIEILIRNWDEITRFIGVAIDEIFKLFEELTDAFLAIFADHAIISAIFEGIATTIRVHVDLIAMLFNGLVDFFTTPFTRLEAAADASISFVAQLFDAWLTGLLAPFKGLVTIIDTVFNVDIVNIIQDAFNTILQAIVGPAIEQFNKIVGKISEFADIGLQKVEVSFERIAAQAEDTGRRIDTGFTGDAIESVADQIAAFRGEAKSAEAQAAVTAVEMQNLQASLGGTGEVLSESEQRMAVLNTTLKDVAVSTADVTEKTEQLGTTTVKTEAEIKAAETAAKAAAKEREKAIKQLADANKQLAADIKLAGAAESEVIAHNLAARMEELNQLEQTIGMTEELATARALAVAEADTAMLMLQKEATAELLEMNEALALDAEMFDMDREERIEKLAQLEMERLNTSLAQLEAQGLANDEIREQVALQKKLIQERADQETGSRPLDMLQSAGMGAMMAFDPASIDQLTGIVDSVTDFPTKLLESLTKLDEALIRFLDEFPNAFAKLAQRLGPILQSIISKLPEVAVTFIQTIVKNLPAIVQGLVMGIKEIAKVLPDLLIGIFENVGPLVEALAEAMPIIAVALIEAVIDLFASGAALEIAISLTKALVFTLPIALTRGLIRGLGKALPGVFGKAGLSFLKPISSFFDGDKMFKAFEPVINALKPVAELFKKAFNLWITPARILFERVIKPILLSVHALFKALFDKTLRPILEGFVVAARIVFEQVIKPIFEGWVMINRVLFEQVVKPIFEGIVMGLTVLFEQVIKPIFDAWVQFNTILFNEVVKPIFEAFVGGLTALFNEVIKPVFDGIVAGFQGVADFFSRIEQELDNFVSSLTSPIDGLTNAVENFKSPADGLKKAMELIRQPMMSLRSGFNFIESPLKTLSRALNSIGGPMKSLAKALEAFDFGGLGGALGGGGGGGIISGAVGGTGGAIISTATGGLLAKGGIVEEQIRYLQNGGNVIPFTPRGSDTVPAMLTPGEFIINRPAVNAIGEPFLKALNTGSVPVNQNINVTLNIETRGQQLDEAFIKQRVMPAAVEAVKRASLDRKFTMSARGLRTT